MAKRFNLADYVQPEAVSESDTPELRDIPLSKLLENGLDVFRTEIRRSVAVGESSYARQPLCDYDPSCNAARDYDALVREYLEEVEA